MSKKYINFIQDFKFIIHCYKDSSIILKGLISNKLRQVSGYEPFDEVSIEYYKVMSKNVDLLLYNIHKIAGR